MLRFLKQTVYCINLCNQLNFIALMPQFIANIKFFSLFRDKREIASSKRIIFASQSSSSY